MNAQVERALSEANRMKEVLETTNRDMGLQIQRLEAGRLGGGFNADIPSLQKQNEELTRKKAALEGRTPRRHGSGPSGSLDGRIFYRRWRFAWSWAWLAVAL